MVQVKCSCGSAVPKTEPGTGSGGNAKSSRVRRNTPRAATKRRSFADIYDSDNDGSDPEYDPRASSNRHKKGKAVVNGDTSPTKSRKSSRKSVSQVSPEPEKGGKRPARERKPSYKGRNPKVYKCHSVLICFQVSAAQSQLRLVKN